MHISNAQSTCVPHFSAPRRTTDLNADSFDRQQSRSERLGLADAGHLGLLVIRRPRL